MAGTGGRAGDVPRDLAEHLKADPAGVGDVPRDDLTRHVKAYLARSGRSIRDLARAARDPLTGIRVSHGWINDIVGETLERAPDLRRLRALAAAMGEPVETLARLAAAQYLGVEVTEVTEVAAGTQTWIAVPVPPGLTEAERDELRARWAEDAGRRERE